MKSTVRIGIGAIIFIALVAITWAISNNGLQAQAVNQPPPTELTVQVSEPVSPADTSNLSVAPTVNPLNDKMVANGAGISEQQAARPLPKAQTGSSNTTDTVVQTAPGIINMPAPDANFEGINNVDGVLPPDTDGEVGPNHYVQMVNLSTAIYDKNGTLLYGPFHPSDLWPAGNACNTRNDGDPVVLYDQLSDRWLLTQFALDFTNNLYYQCIAVSKTGVPTNVPSDWYPYTFLVHTSKMNDYPKLGVWPDGYYMSANQFTGGSSWGGAGVWAFDRAAMLTGSAATFQYFDLAGVNINFGGMLPSDLDGTRLPPAGAPNYFAEVDDSSGIGPNDAIRLWEFHVDWATPANTTFGVGAPGNPNAILDTAPFNLLPCTTSGSRTCISQASSTQKLDSIGDRLMFRLAYRNFGDHESLVVNHTVWADGTDRAGVRWYEIRDPGGSPAIYQQGTYAPADGHNRWMGSVAMDRDGNMAVGYSVSSSTLDPSIRYAGRLVGDPLNTLPQAEGTIITGSGAQTHSAARWGDYSAMSVDPVDDCTFWFTTEYVETTGSAPWQTRIASFKFPGCTAGDAGTLTGLVDDGNNGISGALIVAQGITATVQTTADSSGVYTMTLPVDAYTVTASVYGYIPSSIASVTIVSGTVTTQNFTLTPAATYTVAGVVTDSATGWPLYASIDISGMGYPGATIWTNPETGAYSIDLVGNITYTLSTEAWVDGYLADSSDLYLTANTTENFALDADAATCTAPGYEWGGGFREGFNGSTTPAGWTIVNNGADCDWTFNDPGGRGNLTGGAGNFAIADSDACGSGTVMDTTLYSPIVDVSSLTTVTLAFQYDYRNYSASEAATVDVSNDGGSNWTNIVTWNSDQRGPAQFSQDVTTELGGSTQAQVRFRYDSPGWYWWWEVDDVVIGAAPTCEAPVDGGLLVGNVYDENTSNALNGADVASDGGEMAMTFATPLDAAVDDGFYTIFSPSGSHVFTATMSGGYGMDVQTPSIVNGDTTSQMFDLPAGLLDVTPLSMDITLEMGLTNTLQLDLSNTGNLDADFALLELDKGMFPLGPFETPEWTMKPFKSNDSDARRVNRPQPVAAPFAAGDVIQSWAVTQSGPWGIAYDAFNDTVWVGEGWGDNNVYEYAVDGTLTGNSHSFTWGPANGPADLAYNWNSGMLWSVDVGGDNCIHEIDPASGVTGNTICPAFSTSQRGVAYDPSTDTYFAGSWNDGFVHRFDHTGAILASVDVGLDVSGLAYNPDTEHLFVMVNADPNNVFVLDVANGYALLGQFSIGAGFAAFSGAGLEFGADGSLWAVDQGTKTVYQFDSGESSSLGAGDVLWLSEDPITGTVSATGNTSIDVTFDAGAVTQPGVYHAQLKVNHDTPYALPNVPVTMTVTAPSAFGKLDGTVTGLGYCDANSAVLEDAEVVIESGSGMTTTLMTDAMGYYSFWMDEAGTPVTVTVTAMDHESDMATGVVISGQMTTTVDFGLRWLEPCVSVDPTALEVTILQGDAQTLTLDIVNAGALSTTFELVEIPGGYTTPSLVAITRGAETVGDIALASEVVGQAMVGESGEPSAIALMSSPFAPTASLYDNGSLVTHPSSGAGGLDASALQTALGMASFGFGNQSSAGNRIADDFVVNSTWTVDTITFFAYQTGSGLPSTITGVYLQIWDGPPNDPNSNVIFGDTTTNRMVNTAFSDIYRVLDTSVTNSDRPIMANTVAVGITLTPGTYWLDWMTDGSAASGPWAPPVSTLGSTGNGNAMQYTGTWANVVDVTGQDFPFVIEGVAGEIPWLSENPITSTVSANSAVTIDVTFDTMTYTLGTYTGTLQVHTDDPVTGMIEIPVTMHVVDVITVYLPVIMKP